mmetsp:Transcript_2860/g.2666  ORF Transcript_2860/g.2666 Transcript_2860/m.2666 type:complete len:80 (+) Transcript_2860:454-693(+)
MLLFERCDSKNEIKKAKSNIKLMTEYLVGVLYPQQKVNHNNFGNFDDPISPYGHNDPYTVGYQETPFEGETDDEWSCQR